MARSGKFYITGPRNSLIPMRPRKKSPIREGREGKKFDYDPLQKDRPKNNMKMPGTCDKTISKIIRRKSSSQIFPHFNKGEHCVTSHVALSCYRTFCTSDLSTVYFSGATLEKKDILSYKVKEAHSSIYGGHVNSQMLAKKILRQGYYWPTMERDC